MKDVVVCKIVIADDDPSFCEWLRSLLNAGEGFQVVAEAHSGREAVDLIRATAPGAAIIDACMPELDGFETARYVRDNFPGIKTIVVSALSEKTYERLASESGALAFIPKVRLSSGLLRKVLEDGR